MPLPTLCCRAIRCVLEMMLTRYEVPGDRLVSALLLLDPAPWPEGLGIPAADGHQTPTSVRHQFLALLKQVDALEARLSTFPRIEW